MLAAQHGPPTPEESARITPAEAVAMFGAGPGIRLLEADYLDQAGLTTFDQLARMRQEAAQRRPGVAYQEPPDRLPPPAPRQQAPTWACPNCHQRTAGPWCEACEAGDDWARPPG
jgi:hypothetical protein